MMPDDFAHAPQRRQKQRRMDDFVVESSTGHRESITTAEHLKTRLFYPCVDRMTTEMNRRFSSTNTPVLDGVQACNPSSDNFLDREALTGLAEHYKTELKPEEIAVAQNYLSQLPEDKCSSMAELYRLLDPLIFPSLSRLVQISLTIPVTSCSCERSFSALPRLHSWLPKQ